jgi:hypothetical protein
MIDSCWRTREKPSANLDRLAVLVDPRTVTTPSASFLIDPGMTGTPSAVSSLERCEHRVGDRDLSTGAVLHRYVDHEHTAAAR